LNKEGWTVPRSQLSPRYALGRIAVRVSKVAHVAHALKQAAIWYAYRRQHALRARVDADGSSDDSRCGPALAVKRDGISVAIDDEIRTVVGIRERAGSPDQGGARLLFNAAKPGIHATVRADAVGGPVIELQAFEKPDVLGGHAIEERFVRQLAPSAIQPDAGLAHRVAKDFFGLG